MLALKVESWIWWSFVMAIALSRFISRRMTLGAFTRYQADDWMMMIILCFYTTFLVTINIVANTNSNLFPAGYDVSSLTAADKQEREYGSKLILVVEQCQCVTIWGAKACLLALYLRLTPLHWQHMAIRCLACYVAGTFIVMEILYLGVWCRPFSQYWAVPTDNAQCNAATNHLITNATFNLSSDLIMLGVGLPIFLRMRLPWRKKIPLVAIFSLGLFVVLAAILNRVYSFSQPFGSLWTFWYVRESSTALLVSNLPFVWKFWRKVSGFSSSVSGSQTRPDTSMFTQAATRRRPSAPEDLEFLSEWPLRESREKQGDDMNYRPSPSRGMTLDEFLSEDPKAVKILSAFDDEKTTTTAPIRAILNDSPMRETVRHDSNTDTRHNSTLSSSNLPSTQGSWSASSFA